MAMIILYWLMAQTLKCHLNIWVKIKLAIDLLCIVCYLRLSDKWFNLYAIYESEICLILESMVRGRTIEWFDARTIKRLPPP